MKLLFLILLYFSLSIHSKTPLTFRKDHTFKIVQFTDLHFGEGADVSGPEQDRDSLRVMRTILKLENPDLVVLTGDLITGNNLPNPDLGYNSTNVWKTMITPMLESGFKWAFAFGNHDDLASGPGGSRADIMNFDSAFNLSYSQFGPKNIHGVSNFYLKLYSSTSNQDVNGVLYFFDNPDCNLVAGWGCIYPDQVFWYFQSSIQIHNEYRLSKGQNDVIPSLAFFHIPLQEYLEAYNYKTVVGYYNDSSVACQAVNTGLLGAIKERGDILGTFVGHNHGNDYCTDYYGVQLCFGRHSGYGGYSPGFGEHKRGARVIQLTEGVHAFKTWIRLEDGSFAGTPSRTAPADPKQPNCG